MLLMQRIESGEIEVAAVDDDDGDQAVTEHLEQAPVATRVGAGQRRTGGLVANPDVIEFRSLRVQTGLTQALPSGRERSAPQYLNFFSGDKTDGLREYARVSASIGG